MLARTILALFFAALAVCNVTGCDHHAGKDEVASGGGSDGPPVPWTSSDVVEPADLAKEIGGASGPIVIHVGPEVLFHREHVPGATHAGEASTDEGLAKLEAVARTLPKDRDVVVYCGCCPRSDCPNIRPAYKKLKELGLRVKVLDLPTNFRTDWTKKGLPVDKG